MDKEARSLKAADRIAIEGCFANADDLLRGARGLMEREQLPRLAYHLALVALEEVGKARVLSMKVVSEREDRELPPSIARAMDDHVRKLFWAIWGPSMTQVLITKDQIDKNIGLAQRLHERRIGGLYVDRTAEGVSLPMEQISGEDANSLINFVSACIEMARVSPDLPERVLTPEEEERSRWFFEATDDPERRKLIFGGASMKKLYEFKSVPQWVSWLKETFERSEAESREALEREMRRAADDPAHATPKWRTTVRLYTTSHSIRQKPLNDFNNGLHWLKIRAVSNKNDQLLVDLDAFSSLGISDVWKSSLFMVRRLVMALNVGTLGYFWFHETLDSDAQSSGRFYERITDLESNNELRIHRDPPLRLEFGPRRVLDVRDLNRVVKCFAALIALHGPDEQSICERYLDGAAFVARTDVHMGFELHASAMFYLALKLAMPVFSDWDTASESYPDALRRFCASTFTEFDMEHLARLIDNGEAINKGPVQHPTTMNDVGMMKAICDTYLVKKFAGLDDEWFLERQSKHD
jgi:AbiV family abortive infection protein